MPLYILEINQNRHVYKTKNITILYKYIIDHINDFYDLFYNMLYTDSLLRFRLPELYRETPIIPFIRSKWHKIKDLIKNRLKDVDAKTFFSEIEGADYEGKSPDTEVEIKFNEIRKIEKII
ncbi:hypothetical protein CE11_00920 [Megavirus courdo11]|uniref:Uncharacterized protein n=2 Tax=Megavirus TaxID=3044761 RepID=K7Z8V4_9VIRU|nr:hypothetical protein CE11_00920 [Megavirus courdo11]AUV58784.1 hypothetical protein [Bandra megavirus]